MSARFSRRISGEGRDRTGDPLLAKPNEKVPGFYKLLNLRAVLGIGVEVEGPFGAPYCEKLTTQLTTAECDFRRALGDSSPRSATSTRDE